MYLRSGSGIRGRRGPQCEWLRCRSGHLSQRKRLRGRAASGRGACEDASTDAHRRDFTVNALYYDPSEHHVLDFVGGLEDLRDGGLRAIGRPVERFAEDYLRMLRAVRFAAELGFELDPDTRAAIPPLAHRLANISAERVFDELTKMLTGRDPASAFTLLLDLGLLTVWLPELTRMSGIPQPEQFHPEGDVWEHTRLALTCLRGASAAVAWSALLHDVGKPPTLGYHDNGVPRFHGHARVGADVASGILRRFRTSTKLRKQVAATVNNHMTFSDVQHMRPAKLRRLIGRENFPLELELHRIDCMASHAKVDNYVFLLDKLAEFANEPVLPSPLLDGRDLMTAGVPQGPAVGRLLARLRELQLDGEIRTREQALAWLTHKTE